MTTTNCRSQPLASTAPELSPVTCQQLHLWIRGLPSVGGHFRGHSIQSTEISAAQFFFSFDTSVRTKERNQPASAVFAQDCNTLNSPGMNTVRLSSSRQVHYILLKAHLTTVTPTGSHITEPDGLCGTYDSRLMKVSRTFRTLVLGILEGFFCSPLTSLLHLQASF